MKKALLIKSVRNVQISTWIKETPLSDGQKNAGELQLQTVYDAVAALTSARSSGVSAPYKEVKAGKTISIGEGNLR